MTIVPYRFNDRMQVLCSDGDQGTRHAYVEELPYDGSSSAIRAKAVMRLDSITRKINFESRILFKNHEWTVLHFRQIPNPPRRFLEVVMRRVDNNSK